MIFKPHAYQTRAIRWIIDHPYCALFLDMGLGKTVSTLTALRILLDEVQVCRPLIVAPKKVAEATWTAEAAKWDHLSGTTVEVIKGTPKQRARIVERSTADILAVGRETFTWLVAEYGEKWPFDCLVLDELTSFKNPSAKRFRAMRLVRPSVARVIGLTGTPAPNGYLDLWAQIYCLDQGRRLGQYYTHYMRQYFNPVTVNHIVIRCPLRPGAKEVIMNKISDLCLTMRAEDYLTLPPSRVVDVPLTLPPAVAKGYAELERSNVVQLQEGEITATSAAALITKLSQYTSGAVYDEEGSVCQVHTVKADMLAEIVEAAQGSGVLIYYQYRHEVDRIRRALKGYRVEVYEDAESIGRWNAGEVDALLAHPASTAYGLNLQHGGHYIVWYSLTWDLERYLQANARLHRQGQQHPVTIYRLVCSGTVDERLVAALQDKGQGHNTLMSVMTALTSAHNDAGGVA